MLDIHNPCGIWPHPGEAHRADSTERPVMDLGMTCEESVPDNLDSQRGIKILREDQHQ